MKLLAQITLGIFGSFLACVFWAIVVILLTGKAHAQPLPPASLVAEIPETNWITLEWNPSTSPGVMGYQVASNSVPSNYFVFVKTVGTNISLIEPSIGTSNWFAVRCSNSTLFSVWSAPLLYYVAPPKPVTNITYIHARFATNFPFNILTSGVVLSNFIPILLTNTGSGVGTNKSGWYWLVASNRSE